MQNNVYVVWVGLVLIGGGLAGCQSAVSDWSGEECEARYEALADEEQEAFNLFFQRVDAASDETERKAIAATGTQIYVDYLPRFQVLSENGCGRAKVEILNSLGHLEPFDPAYFDYALGLLRELVEEDANAWWILDLADNDIIRYFLVGPHREEAISLFDEFTRETSDEEASREVMLEVSRQRHRAPSSPADRAEALETLEALVARWQDSPQAEKARRELTFARELAVGASMPPLVGRGADGHPLSLADFRGKVVLVDFYGFW